MHSAALLPLLAGLAIAQPVSNTIPANVNPTPDALPLDFLANVEIPTYTTIDGLSSQDIPYATETAIAAVVAAQSETPLSVFPAATGVAINEAGDSADAGTASPTAAASKRASGSIHKRAACAAQATLANKYNVELSSASAFRASTKIADVAKAAKVPAGYYNNFVNAAGSSSAYAYLGYTVPSNGYDVDFCAAECDKKTGCLAFNIFFERDPTLEPGTGCKNPDAFANIMCTFWGSALDASTATNTGQWRADFEVATAGSNGYTSNKVGGKIDGWSDPIDLKTATMAAPLYDAAETWTYLGYKLFQDGPYDANLCAAACDAQTAYNIAHPPASGYTPLCAAFNTYQLTVTDRKTSKSSVVGQMCNMYTSAFDASYATNTVAWNDAIMTKYTYSLSFFYSKAELQPVSPSDLSALNKEGGAFCTSYVSYAAPTTTATSTVTPAVSTISSIASYTETSTVYTRTVTATTGSGFGKRDDGDALIVEIITASSDLIPRPSAVGMNSTLALARRLAVATPAAVSGWSPLKISAACSRVATGTITETSKTTLATALTTVSASTTTTKTVSLVTTISVAAPSSTIIAIGTGTGYSGSTFQQSRITLPFAVSGYGVSNNQISLDKYGWMCIENANYDGLRLYFEAFDADDLEIRAGTGDFISGSITGSAGSRQVIFEWNVSSKASGAGGGRYRFTTTFFEDKPGVQVYRFYDVWNDARLANSYSPGYIRGIGMQLNGKQPLCLSHLLMLGANSIG